MELSSFFSNNDLKKTHIKNTLSLRLLRLTITTFKQRKSWLCCRMSDFISDTKRTFFFFFTNCLIDNNRK